ncbi:hypothetical protein OF83DRAFT_1044034, partial [Amylostereum chailletii]
KFMPCFDGPYVVKLANPARSSYTLDMPAHPNLFSTFHSSLLKPFLEPDPELAPDHVLSRPAPVILADGSEEYLVDSIVDEH